MKTSFACLAVLPVLLAACATPAPTPERDAAPAVAQRPIDSEDLQTGSRIPSRRTEKMVGRIGAQDYKETKQTLAAPLESR